MSLPKAGFRRWIICLAPAAVTLAGCQPESTVAARVNSVDITMNELGSRAMATTSEQIQPGGDAGSTAMTALVTMTLIDQLARKDRLEPSKEVVDAAVNHQMHMVPGINIAITAKRITADDLRRDIKSEIERVRIGSSGAHADEAQMRRIYDSTHPGFPEYFMVRVLPVFDPIMAQKVAAALKSNPEASLSIAARAADLPAQMLTSVNTVRVLPTGQFPGIDAAMRKLKPRQVTRNAVPLPASPQSGQPARNTSAFFEMVSRGPAYKPSYEEIKPILEMQAVQQTQPEWTSHYQQELSRFAATSDIQIMIDRYKGVKDAILAPPQPVGLPQGGPGSIQPSMGGPGRRVPSGRPAGRPALRRPRRANPPQ